MQKYIICSRCILDTTVPGIAFDNRGVCNYCKLHDRFEERYPLNDEGKRKLNQLIEEIKKSGKKKKYDCLVGLSGGRDSSYLIYWAIKSGLKPLAVFYDSGWYSNQSKENMQRIVSKLDVDLITIDCALNEYSDLQRSFLKASTNDIDAPDDQAIITVLYRSAAKYGIRHILSGHSFRTEGNTPIGWSYMDGKYVRDVHKKFGKVKLRIYPTIGFFELLKLVLFNRIKFVYPLEFVEYDRDKVSELLAKEFGWVYAGGHHFDCQYIHLITRVLREKFNIDKRKVEYSALIRSGQILREKSLELIKNDPAPESDELVKYSLKRIGVTEEEYKQIMDDEPKSFLDYKTYFDMIRIFRFPIQIACKMGILPMSLYEKYIKLAKDLKHFNKNKS